MAAKITSVICHYNPPQDPYLRHLAGVCVHTQKQMADPDLAILLCDGSPEPDPALAAEFAADPQVTYLHGGRQLSFGATYNMGVQAAESEFVVLIANDILILSRQIRALVDRLQGDVGCTIPYLLRSDYGPQVRRRQRVPKVAWPASMTFNVNAFRRPQLLEIGGVPEELSGYYNDAVVHHRLRARGLRIALVQVGQVDHLQAVTRRTVTAAGSGQDRARYQRDLAQAQQLEPELFRGVDPQRQKNYWAHLYANSAQTRGSRWLWRAVSWWPRRLHQARGLGYWAGWLEPYFSAERRG